MQAVLGRFKGSRASRPPPEGSKGLHNRQANLGARKTASRGLHSLVGFFRVVQEFWNLFIGSGLGRVPPQFSRFQGPGERGVSGLSGHVLEPIVPPEGFKILQGSQVFQASRPGSFGPLWLCPGTF